MEKYDKVKVLGKGSFGSAVLVRRKLDRQLFVAKEIQIGSMKPQEREEARQEFRVLQSVRHPNIIQYIEHFETKQRLYIIMEYADGGDLYQRLKGLPQGGKGLSEETVMRYFCQLSLAIQHLHEQHILHRDIKTMNVFLTSAGVVKLGDFGVATVLRNTMALARTVCGTPYYFSPELCRNAPYNNKSDVWALGCVLYEMCTLRNAFDGVNMKALVAKILKGVYPPLPSHYSPEMRTLVGALLQRSPLSRPGINGVLAMPVVRKALGKLENDIIQVTSHRKGGGVSPPPPPVPLPPVVSAMPLPAMMVIEKKPVLDPKPRGNILRAPQERVKAWQEEREKEKQAKKEAEARRKMELIKARLEEVEQVRAQGWLQQRNEKKRLEQEKREEDARSVQELDNQLKRAVDIQSKARAAGFVELRQWVPPAQAIGKEVEKMAWDQPQPFVPPAPLRRGDLNGGVRRSASVNSPGKAQPPPPGAGLKEEAPPPFALGPERSAPLLPRHGRRSHSTSTNKESDQSSQGSSANTQSFSDKDGQDAADFLSRNNNPSPPPVAASPPPPPVEEYLVMQAQIRDIFSRPQGIEVEENNFGDEATIDPNADENADDDLDGDGEEEDEEESIAAVDVSGPPSRRTEPPQLSASMKQRSSQVAQMVHSLFPHGGSGSVHNRAEAVRFHLDSLLGTETFLRAYRVLEHLSPDSADDDVIKVCQGIMGQQHSFLIPLLTQLIVCDEEANAQS